MGTAYDVCIIEGKPADRRYTLKVLSGVGYVCSSAEDGEGGWIAINENRPKVVVCARDIRDCDGRQLCRRIRESPELTATFFLMVGAGTDSGDLALVLEGGVDDYVTTPIDPAILRARVRVGIRMWEVNERLRKAAVTDGLTGLFNHDHLNFIIDREVKRARRYGGRLSLIMIDLDFFKAVNDTFGHLVGNDTLVEVARLLTESIRDVDTVGRFGGEEFVIVAPEAAMDEALIICERVRRAITDEVQVPALGSYRVTASFGIATADDARVRSAAGLVDLADRALYIAKSKGRNQVATALDVRDDTSFAIEADEVESLRKQVAILSVQAKEVYVQTVSSLLQALEEKDPFTARHSLNVAYYGERIARGLGLNEPLSVSIRNAGLLHDIGKVGIPDRILMKPSKLTFIEETVMRQVPAISVRIIDYLRILDSEMHIIRHQGEYYDGSGYPDGLRGEQIPIGSRVLLVANAFDAMTTDRVYRPCRSIDDSLDEIKANAGTQFDPRAVEALESLLQTDRSEVQERIKGTMNALRLAATTH